MRNLVISDGIKYDSYYKFLTSLAVRPCGMTLRAKSSCAHIMCTPAIEWFVA